MGIPKVSGWIGCLLLGLMAFHGHAQEPSNDASPAATSVNPVPVAAADSEGPSVQRTTKRELSILSQEFWLEFFSSPISFLLLFMVAFYLLIFLPGQRSSKKAQRDQEQLLANLKKNDRVVTAFGVHGVISNINSDSGTVTIRVDENTNAKLTVNRDTIRVVKKD